MKNLLKMLLAVAVAVAITACTGEKKQENTETPQPKAVAADTTAQKVEEPNKAVPEVIDFYATWCGPCKRLAPVLEKLEKEYAGKIKFTRVDVDQDPALANQYSVQSIPTLVMKPVKGESTTFVGLMSESELRAELDKLVASSTPNK